MLCTFYVNTFRSRCVVPNISVFCSSMISCFPDMLLRYFLNNFETGLVIPAISFVFTFLMRCISVLWSVYFKILLVSFLITHLLAYMFPFLYHGLWCLVLLRIVLSVFICWFHVAVSLPSRLVSADFVTCSSQCSLSDFTYISLRTYHHHLFCISNFMKLNVNKTRVISLSRKTNLGLFDYKLYESLVTRTEFIKDLGVQIDSKLHFRHHVDYIFSQAVRLLGLIRTVTFCFSSLQSLLMLYYTLVRPKLEYASVAWNSITSTVASKLEHIQRTFVILCHRRFFSHSPYSHTNVLNCLKFHILGDRRCHWDALFLLNVFIGSKFCPALLETVGLRVPYRNFRDF
jgi:hypothetical protein